MYLQTFVNRFYFSVSQRETTALENFKMCSLTSVETQALIRMDAI